MLRIPPRAQETDVTPDKEIVAEQYFPVGTPTRACGESQVAINPANRNQIVVVAAMCILNTQEGKGEQTEEMFTHTPRAAIALFAFTRDRGLTWTLKEDAMRDYYRRYRCLDPFSAFTARRTDDPRLRITHFRSIGEYKANID